MNRKFTCNGQGIAFEGSWSFGNEFARNVAIFGVNNSWSFYTDNGKNILLVPGEGPTNGINDRAGELEKKKKKKKKSVLALVK